MSTLFSTPKTPTLPAVKEPVPMPDTDAKAEARRKKAVMTAATKGRASTFLSEGSDVLGG